MGRLKAGSGFAAVQSQSDAQSAQAQEFFSSAVRDPHNPRYCGACLLGAFAESTQAERNENHASKKLKNRESSTSTNYEFWDAVLAFLMLRRTDKQLERLLIRLSNCTCRMIEASEQVKRFHVEGKSIIDGLTPRMIHVDALDEHPPGSHKSELCKSTFIGRAFILELFTIFSKAISQGSIKSAAKGNSQSWPRHATDLIPHGADSAVQAMLQWHSFIPDFLIFSAMAFSMRIGQLLITPSVIKYKSSDTLILASRRLVDMIMADLISDDENARVRASQRFQLFIPHLVTFFDVLSKEIALNAQAAIWRGCETKAMQLCSIFLYLSSDPNLPWHGVEGWAEQLVVHGQMLFRFFHMHMPPRPSMPVHPKVEALDSMFFPPAASIRSPRETTLFAIQHFRKENRCSAQGCPNTLQSVGRAFQRCGRCTIVSYCGRECQSKAWRDEQYPHKRICPLLKSLVEIGGGSALFFGQNQETKDVILYNWDMAGIDEEHFVLIADWNRLIDNSREYAMPDGTEWTPGYDDYDEIIMQLSIKGRGPKPKYINRLQRWPSEVAKEESLLKLQPFWNQDVIC